MSEYVILCGRAKAWGPRSCGRDRLTGTGPTRLDEIPTQHHTRTLLPIVSVLFVFKSPRHCRSNYTAPLRMTAPWYVARPSVSPCFPHFRLLRIASQPMPTGQFANLFTTGDNSKRKRQGGACRTLRGRRGWLEQQTEKGHL